jgi:hypothetical protein
MDSLAFVACIEAGILEKQALLLFQSIRRFAGPFSECPIYAYSPRAGRDISGQAKRMLDSLGVVHIDDELNTHRIEYGTVNRIVAAGHAEANLDTDFICVIDSDTIFVRPPDAFALPNDVDMLARPVDVKGRCTAGADDPNDSYWRTFCDLCEVSYDDIPFITAAIDGQRSKASYNGGLIVVRRNVGILQRTETFFLASLSRDLAPCHGAQPFRASTGPISSEQASWWGSSQIALSLAAWSLTERIRHFDATYNYPLHLHHQAPDDLRRDAWPMARHIHYHWLLHDKPEEKSPLFGNGTPLTIDQQSWLRANCELELT